MTRDDVIQAALVAATAGGSGGAIASMISIGFKSDDVFAFSGALVGAAGTVAGAAWLADRVVTKERREEQRSIIDELLILQDSTEVARDAHPVREWDDQWRSAIHALGDVAEGCGRFIDEVIGNARTLNFSQREQIRRLRGSIARFMSFYDDVFLTEEDLDPQDDRTWLGMLNSLLSSVQSAASAFRRS